jgi:hypothetical protein
MSDIRFKCKRSGNIVSFSNENDIAGLRKHEGYDEITSIPVPDAPMTFETPVIVEAKRRGRKRKELVNA